MSETETGTERTMDVLTLINFDPSVVGDENPHTEQQGVRNVEPKIILLRGLNKNTSNETIRNLAESKANEYVMEIIRIQDKTSALINFEKIIDFKNTKEKVESRSLDGANVTVHRVSVGGELTSIQYDEGNEQATRVTFNKDRDEQLPPPPPPRRSRLLPPPPPRRSRLLPPPPPPPRSRLPPPPPPPPLPRLPPPPPPRRSQLLPPPPPPPRSRLPPPPRLLPPPQPSPPPPSHQCIRNQEGTSEHHSQHKIAVAVNKDVMELISATDSLSELQESLRVQDFTMKYSSGDSFVYIALVPERGISAANEERGIETVRDFTKQFKAMELDVDKNHWDAVITEISKLQKEIGKDKLLVKECVSLKEKVTIICRKGDSKELKKTFMDVIEKTQSLEAKKAYIVDTIRIEKESLRLLQITGYKEELVSEYSDLDVDIDEANSKVTIQGPRQQCCEAIEKIRQKVLKFSKKKIFCKSKMFNDKEIFEKIGAGEAILCYNDNIHAVFHISNGITVVTGINEDHAVEACSRWTSLIIERKIEVDHNALNVTEDKLDVFCKEVSQEFKVCVSRNSDFSLYIAGIKKDVSRAQIAINKFLDNKTYRSSLDKEMMRYIFDHRKEELSKMENDYSVSINKDEKEPDKILIQGARMGSDLALKAIKDLEDSVSIKKMKVQQPGLHKLVASGKLDRLIRKTERDHKCTIARVENKPIFSSASTADSKKCGNVTISWKQGSIVTEPVSMLVSSSTGKLFETFVKAGGPKFLKQAMPSYCYMRVINETGNLPCDYVILVSCCSWEDDKGEAEKDLRSIVRACLQQAIKFEAASIAFPVIGTGGLGFPYDKASQIMIREVINVTMHLEEVSLKDICFVVFDQDAKLVNAFEQEFTKAFEESGSGTVSRWQRMSIRRTNYALGDVSVEVVNGDLTKEETDTIVNINAIDMNMQKAGEISKAIAAAAGPAVQIECTKLGQQAAGSVVVTGAGKLKAKHIIHMIPGEATVQHIQQCIEKCLETADKSKFKSLSIPACGTGGFKLSAGDSAQSTFQALLKVRSHFKHLKKVRIVIFKSELLPEFSKKLDEYKTRIRNDTFGESGGSKKVDWPKTTSIELRVYGKSKEVVDEATADLTRALTEACKTKTIEHKDISKLSEDQRKVLKEKASDLEVEIKFDDINQRISIQGNPEDVMEILNQSWEEIQNVQQDEVIILLPGHWCPMPKENGKEKTVHLVPLSKGSDEYKKVLKLFQDTGGTGKLLKIERIQNPHLYKQYVIRKEKMDKDNGGMKNERQLFHGTAGGNVNDINTRGFNRIFRGSRVGNIYGEGVYFAKNASYSYSFASPDANKNRHMYVARVLVGRYVLGNKQMKVPPPDPKTGTNFDSTADKNGSDASIFVAFFDAQCYPQYLITFQ